MAGEGRKLFIRGATVYEIDHRGDSDALKVVTPEKLANLVEKLGRVARREIKKTEDGPVTVWRTSTFPTSHAKTLLENDAAYELPPIRQLVNCPIITPDGEILSRGYHEHSGGTYIGRGGNIPEIPIEAARTALMGLLVDFDFPTPSDLSRAMASLISPALKMGGWINDDFPIDLAEADQSQSGKTFRQKLNCLVYREAPTSITLSKGGVGSLDEAIASALIRGRPFITLGNIRGKVDSAILEEALRGSGRVTCRTLRQSAEVDCRPFLWQLSTNGAELTRDLANRAIVTRIRKQPAGYQFRHYPEGDAESHVSANQEFYLGAVFAVLREWASAGRPVTTESRHDFREWCRALDWIVQNIMGLAPLLDGHREQQDRTANPALQWLREILLAARLEDMGRPLGTGEILRIAEDAGIDFPGNPHSRDDPAIRAGRILGKIFRDAEADAITVDGFIFTRGEAPDYSPNAGGSIRKNYTIEKA